MFKSLEKDDETSKEISEQKRIIELGEQKKNKLLELVTTGAITTASFRSMTATCDRGEIVTGRPKNVAGCHRCFPMHL